MLIISKKAQIKLSQISPNYYIVADFDRTITASNSESSWGVLSKSNLVPNSYIQERQKLFQYYRPIELDLTMNPQEKNQHMIDWWQKHIKLLIKYQLTEEIIKEVATNPQMMSFRPGAKEFLIKMHKQNIPIIIISAGIGNFIQEFLKK